MEWGEFFIIVAGFLLLFDFILLLKAKAEEKKKLQLIAFFASIIACVLVIASYIRLTTAFLTDNFSLGEVFWHSSSSLALQYKLGDPWIGSNGSMLFITFLLALIYLAYRFKGLGKETEFRNAAYKILDLFLIFLIFLTLLKSPFELVPGIVLPDHIPLDGFGLNPLLQTFWVLVHPPVVFLGYVFVFFAFALTLGGIITGDSEEGRATLKRSLYAAWLFLALGIALGGLWSYEVLGWGGYWAWDPVETASLLPWFSLTAYFHLSARSKDMAKEFTLLITFCMIIFATALTRGGLLESVHAFGESSIGPLLLGFALCVIIYFIYLAIRANKPLYSFDIDTSSLYSVAIFTAYWSLMVLLVICFLGLAAPILKGLSSGTPMSALSVDYYNWCCYPFTLVFVAALMGCNISRNLKKRYAMLLAALLGIGAVLVLLRMPTSNPLLNFGLPLLIVAWIVIAYNFALLLPKNNSSKSLKLWGKTFVHLAIILILIGVFVSAIDAAKEPSGYVAKPNSSIDILGMQIEFGDSTVYSGTGSVYYSQHQFVGPEYSAMGTDITIKEGKKVHHETLWMYYYANHGVVSEPLIISAPVGDIYVSMQQTPSSYNSMRYALITGEVVPPEDFNIWVKKVPLIWLVWLGIALMGFAMVILLFSELQRKNKQK